MINTGAARYYCDAKILPCYEGTTAVQANDLVGRKTARDGSQGAKAISAQSGTQRVNSAPAAMPRPRPWARLQNARDSVLHSMEVIAAQSQADSTAISAGSFHHLMLTGGPDVGWQLGHVLQVAERELGEGNDEACMSAKVATVRAYVDHIRPRASAVQSSAVIRACARWHSTRSEQVLTGTEHQTEFLYWRSP